MKFSMKAQHGQGGDGLIRTRSSMSAKGRALRAIVSGDGFV